MRQLLFNVKGQTLDKSNKSTFNGIVAGTSGYLAVKFIFYGNDWAGCTKAASFWIDDQEYGALLDKYDSCLIPKEALVGDRFEVSLTGMKDDYIIKTNKIEVRQEVV